MSDRKCDDRQRAEVLERVERGEKYRTIAWELGVSEAWVCRFARKNGLKRLPGGPRRKSAA